MLTIFLAVVLSLGGASACRPGGGRGPEPAPPPSGAPPAGQRAAALDALPWAQRIALEQAIAAKDPRHAPRMDNGAPALGAGAAVARFSARGGRIALGGHEASLAAAGIGRDGGARRELASGAGPIIAGPAVRTDRGAGVVEWWRSLPSGLEHGLTIAERPAGTGALVIEVEARGDLVARALSPDAIALASPGGVRVATYSHLFVIDAAGARVPAWMDVRRGRIALALDDAAARYPIVVDPIVITEEATLVAPFSGIGDEFGYAVALSSDGSRALVGVPFHDNDQFTGNVGSARVFVRTGATWTEEAMLVAPDAATNDEFGYSVALSADGSRALVGVPDDTTAGGAAAGSARVFLRTGSTWAQEATLLAPDGAANDNLGWSVAISSDGTRAVVGAPLDDTAGGANAGSARVFLRTGSTWAQEATLLAPDGAANDNLGWSVAISSDGTRVVAGAPLDDVASLADAGTARVFLRTGTAWAQELSLFSSDRAASDNLGWSVAISSDGTRVIVGVPLDDNAGGTDAGSARLFLRNGATWSEEATLLAAGGAASDNLGWSVAISSDGTRALVGAPLTGAGDAGSARVYLRTGATWTEETALLGASNEYHIGGSVALASDGSRALAGAPATSPPGVAYAGSAHVYLRTGTSWASEVELAGAGGGTGDLLGYSVGLSSDGSRALVGAPGTSGTVAARVFLRSGATWTEEAALTVLGYSEAGWSVALTADGSRAVLGAPLRGIGYGSAFIFARSGSTWTQEAQLTSASAMSDDEYGLSVAIAGDGSRALVGAPYGLAPGYVHVFVRNGTTWTEETVLSTLGGQQGDQFGFSVALSPDGTRALVGDPYDDTASGTDAGSAHVFTRSGSLWTEEATLLASDGAASDRLGWSVALASDGGRALVGAPYDVTFPAGDTGSARVFMRTGATWVEEAMLLPFDGASADRFGYSVALSADGSAALIGAPYDDTVGGTDAGSGRLFLRSGTSWTEEATLLASDGRASDILGYGAALSADAGLALVGAPGDTTKGGANSGAVRVFDLTAARDPNGTVCTSGATCTSGFCVDGVCCDTACGGGATNDCQACSIAAGAGSDGTCAALTGPACDDGNSCTYGETCAAGACAGGLTVTCTSDACNTRACNGTASCSVTPLSGTTCNDGNACTQTDTCQAGICTGSNPVACAAAGACHVAGSCNPATGACSNPPAADGTTCNDGNACTRTDTCQAGVCAGSNPVACAGADACHVAGSCDPATGACSNPAAADGTACSDGTGCTIGDMCLAGVCTGTPMVCAASDSCHVAGTCNPASGQCSNPQATNGTPCSGGLCQSGVCTPIDAGAGDGGPDAAGGAGGRGGAGGAGGTGGTAGTGGGAGTGGSAGAGGAGGSAGSGGRGGAAGAGGTAGTGGTVGADGGAGTGGAAGVGGAGTGGTAGAAGAGGAGGAAGTGGGAGAAGVTGTAGAGGTGGTGGTAGHDGGADAVAARDGGGDASRTDGAASGCGCGVSSGRPTGAPLWLGFSLLLVARSRRRRRP